MKKRVSLLIVVLGLATISCIKENPVVPVEDNTDLVQMTFTASSSDNTKAILGEDGLTVNWQEGDQIKVITSDSANPFAASNINGKTAEFSGWTQDGVDTYYAVYPAVAAPSEGWVTTSEHQEKNYIGVTIPVTQTAVDNSFDPRAFVAVSKTSDGNFNFSSIVSAIKFKLTNPENIDRIIFRGVNVSNDVSSYAILAGTGYVDINNGLTTFRYNLENYGTKESAITLLAPADGFKADKYYYITFRPNLLGGGVELYFVLKDGTVHKAVNKTALFDAAPINKVKDLQTLNYSIFPKASNYEIYQILGRNLKIGDIVINKSTYGDATLINADSKTKNVTSGVFFIDPAFSEATISSVGKTIVISNTDERATITRDAATLNLSATADRDYFMMKNINYVAKNVTTRLFSGKGTGSFEDFYFDKVSIEIPEGKSVFYSSFPLENVSVTDCDIKLHAGTGELNLFQQGESCTYKKVVFSNNVIWSCDGDRQSFSLFKNRKSTISDIKVTYNTLAGVYPAASYGYVQAKTMSAGNLQNNLLLVPNYGTLFNDKYTSVIWISDDSSLSKEDQKTYKSPVNIAGTVVYYGASIPQGRVKNTYYLDSTNPSAGSLYNKTDANNPVPSPDYTKGVFIQNQDNANFGAKR